MQEPEKESVAAEQASEAASPVIDTMPSLEETLRQAEQKAEELTPRDPALDPDAAPERPRWLREELGPEEQQAPRRDAAPPQADPEPRGKDARQPPTMPLRQAPTLKPVEPPSAIAKATVETPGAAARRERTEAPALMPSGTSGDPSVGRAAMVAARQPDAAPEQPRFRPADPPLQAPENVQSSARAAEPVAGLAAEAPRVAEVRSRLRRLGDREAR